MKELIENTKDFKIIPNNFKSSGAFNVIDADNEKIKAKLILSDKKELADYTIGSNVEVFGVNDIGLVYFETVILDINDDIITLAVVPDYSIIQRREYSRVGLNQGRVIFKDFAPGFIKHVEDISAGGIKIISSNALELDKHYDIEIILSNNMKIECAMQPIRISETEYNNEKCYTISGKFINLENMDRIVLVQYAFKIKMEEQNKENE